MPGALDDLRLMGARMAEVVGLIGSVVGILWAGGGAGCAGPATPMSSPIPPLQVSVAPTVEPTQRLPQVPATFTVEPTPLPPVPAITATPSAEPTSTETRLPWPSPTSSVLDDPSEFSIQLGFGGAAGEGCYDFRQRRQLPAGTALDGCDVALAMEGNEPVLVAYSGMLMDQRPRILDAGPVDLRPAGLAPTTGYRTREKATERHVYWLQTRGGGLIRFRVERLSRDRGGGLGLELRCMVVRKELAPCCGL